VNTSVEVTVVVVEFVVATDDSDSEDVATVTFSSEVDTFSEENVNNALVVVSDVSDVVNVEVMLVADSELADVEEASVERVEDSDGVVDVEVESDDKVVEVEDKEALDNVLAVDSDVEDDSDDSASVETGRITELAEESSEICEDVETTDVVGVDAWELLVDGAGLTELDDCVLSESEIVTEGYIGTEEEISIWLVEVSVWAYAADPTEIRAIKANKRISVANACRTFITKNVFIQLILLPIRVTTRRS